jgi:hypothetical protein
MHSESLMKSALDEPADLGDLFRLTRTHVDFWPRATSPYNLFIFLSREVCKVCKVCQTLILSAFVSYIPRCRPLRGLRRRSPGEIRYDARAAAGCSCFRPASPRRPPRSPAGSRRSAPAAGRGGGRTFRRSSRETADFRPFRCESPFRFPNSHLKYCAMTDAQPASSTDARPPHRTRRTDAARLPLRWAAKSRTREGELYRRVARQLRAHVGRPSAAEELLISRIAWLSVHMAHIDEVALRDGGLSQHATREYLAWANSLAKMIAKLGLRPCKPHQPSLAEQLAEDTRRRIAAAEVPA